MVLSLVHVKHDNLSTLTSKIEASDIIDIGDKKFFTKLDLLLIFIVFDMFNNYIKLLLKVKQFLMNITNFCLFK